MPLTKAKKTFGVVATVIGVVTAGWGLWEKIDSKFEEMEKAEMEHIEKMVDKRVKEKVDEFYSKKKGSLSNDLADGLGIDRKFVPEEIIYLYMDFYEIYPSIEKELYVIDIGLKYDKEKNEIYYIHTDGKRYNVSFDTTNDWYYFMDKNGVKRTCK